MYGYIVSQTGRPARHGHGEARARVTQWPVVAYLIVPPCPTIGPGMALSGLNRVMLYRATRHEGTTVPRAGPGTTQNHNTYTQVK